MIQFSCPQCGHKLTVKDELAGKSGKCKKCGELLRVPSPAPETIAEDDYEEVEAEIVNPPRLPSVPQRMQPSPRRVAGTIVTQGEHTHLIAAPGQPLAVQVNVQQPSRAAHSLGITSLILGMIALPMACIPFLGIIGLPLSGLGFLLACIGIVMAIARSGAGIGFSIGGAAVCLLAIGILGAQAMMVAGGTAAAVETVEALDNAIDESNKRQAKERKQEQQAVADAWANAGMTASVGDVVVRIVNVTVGKAKVKDRFRDEEHDTVEDWLQIFVEIKNNSKNKKIDFHGWGTMTTFGGSDVKLTDEAGNRYKILSHDLTSPIVGQLGAESIYPGKSVADVVLFEPPVDGVKEMRLELTSRRLDGKEPLRFKFPPPQRVVPNIPADSDKGDGPADESNDIDAAGKKRNGQPLPVIEHPDTPPPEDKPKKRIDPEKVASSKLLMAKNLLRSDKVTNKESVKKRLQSIIDEFPETKAAEESKDLLETLK